MNQYSVNTVETSISGHPISSSLLKTFANEKQTTGVLLLLFWQRINFTACNF